jgi:hypothetical protein
MMMTTEGNGSHQFGDSEFEIVNLYAQEFQSQRYNFDMENQ